MDDMMISLLVIICSAIAGLLILLWRFILWLFPRNPERGIKILKDGMSNVSRKERKKQ